MAVNYKLRPRMDSDSYFPVPFICGSPEQESFSAEDKFEQCYTVKYNFDILLKTLSDNNTVNVIEIKTAIN